MEVNGAENFWVSVHLRSLRSSVLHAVPSGSLRLRALQAASVCGRYRPPRSPNVSASTRMNAITFAMC
jgi:hypothetical protein